MEREEAKEQQLDGADEADVPPADEPEFKRPTSATAHRKRPAPGTPDKSKPVTGMRRLMAYKRQKAIALATSSSSVAQTRDETGSKVAYIYSSEATVAADLLPVSKGKVERTHALAAAYGLLQPSLVRLVAPQAATREQLMEYHDSDYLDRLIDTKPQPKLTPEKRNIFAKHKRARHDAKRRIERSRSSDEDSSDSDDSDGSSDGSSDEEELRDGDEEFGLQHDCSPFPGVFQHATMTAGATLIACDELKSKRASVAINWMGGRHHAKKYIIAHSSFSPKPNMIHNRDEAAGFCYVNDIVLAILSLMNSYPKILYIDLDIHHGDGVEEAFYYTDKVFCMSIHHYAPGFYPGTGRLNQIGAGKGKYYTMNVPLKAGIVDETYTNLFRPLVSEVFSRYCPNAVVLQCGVDGLVGDPLGGFNLTLKGVGDCVNIVQNLCKLDDPSTSIPLLVLGGGGYHSTNAARAYTYLTSILLHKELQNDIPEHRFFEDYKDNGFQLHVSRGNEPDRNDPDSIDRVRTAIMDHLSHIKSPDV